MMFKQPKFCVEDVIERFTLKLQIYTTCTVWLYGWLHNEALQNEHVLQGERAKGTTGITHIAHPNHISTAGKNCNTGWNMCV